MTPAAALARSALLGGLPPEVREALAARLRPMAVAAGEAVVREGEPGDTYYLIAEGEAAVWITRAGAAPATLPPVGPPDPTHQQLVGRLGPGDGFGEMALLLDGPRRATVFATTDLLLYMLDRAPFRETIDAHPLLATVLTEELTLRSIANTLGKASPFANLPPEALRWLAVHLVPVRAARGEAIVRQGERGDALYLLVHGQTEVVIERADGGEQRLAVLEPGAAFGEQALLADAPRSATVRALAEVELLRLSRDDFETVLRLHQDRGIYFVQLALQRQRPRPAPGCTLEPWVDSSGTTTSYILKNPATYRYMKLSEQAAFVWGLIDGERTVRDLTVAYFRRYQVFGLDTVMGLMLQLHAAGFVAIQQIDRARLLQSARLSPVQRLGVGLLPWLSHYFSLPDLDRPLTRLYRTVCWPLFTRPAQLALLLCTLVGAGRFLTLLQDASLQPSTATLPSLAIPFLLAFALQGILHECGHALSCKHFGREVHRAGVGWYFFMPVGFVDTSDIWLAGKWPRAATAFAGPYANFALSGLASLLIPFAPSGPAQWVLFQFATTGYILGIVNLNPLMAFDGYYVLMDGLEIPNLRAKALGYVGALLWREPPGVDDPRLRRIYLLYGVLALGYVLFVAAAVLEVYRGHLYSLVGNVLPHLATAIVGWVVAGLLAGVILCSAWSDLRRGVTAARRAGRATGAAVPARR